MTTFERIKELARKRNVNLKELSLDLGFGVNYIYSIKTQEASAEKLKKIADYFKVSVDYLLCRTDNPTILEDDSVSYFRLNTSGMNEDEIEELERELNDFQQFMKMKIEQKRKQNLE